MRSRRLPTASLITSRKRGSSRIPGTGCTSPSQAIRRALRPLQFLLLYKSEENRSQTLLLFYDSNFSLFLFSHLRSRLLDGDHIFLSKTPNVNL